MVDGNPTGMSMYQYPNLGSDESIRQVMPAEGGKFAAVVFVEQMYGDEEVYEILGGYLYLTIHFLYTVNCL